MKTIKLDMPITINAAIEVQLRICRNLIRKRIVDTSDIHLIAGADAGYTSNGVTAGITVVSVPQLKVACSSVATTTIQFPYISGLLAFREGPALIAAYEKLDQAPDAIIFNGHGYAHPRRCGLATHLGILLDLPSIGVAKRLMIGNLGALGTERGSIAPIHDGSELIGIAVRTQENARPIYASIGHKVDLEQAVELILMTTTSHRFPEPLWLADQCVRKAKKGAILST